MVLHQTINWSICDTSNIKIATITKFYCYYKYQLNQSTSDDPI